MSNIKQVDYQKRLATGVKNLANKTDIIKNNTNSELTKIAALEKVSNDRITVNEADILKLKPTVGNNALAAEDYFDNKGDFVVAEDITSTIKELISNGTWIKNIDHIKLDLTGTDMTKFQKDIKIIVKNAGTTFRDIYIEDSYNNGTGTSMTINVNGKNENITVDIELSEIRIFSMSDTSMIWWVANIVSSYIEQIGSTGTSGIDPVARNDISKNLVKINANTVGKQDKAFPGSPTNAKTIEGAITELSQEADAALLRVDGLEQKQVNNGAQAEDLSSFTGVLASKKLLDDGLAKKVNLNLDNVVVSEFDKLVKAYVDKITPKWNDITATYQNRVWKLEDIGKKVKIKYASNLWGVGLIEAGNDTHIEYGKINIHLGVWYTDGNGQVQIYYSSEKPNKVGIISIKSIPSISLHEEYHELTEFHIMEKE